MRQNKKIEYYYKSIALDSLIKKTGLVLKHKYFIDEYSYIIFKTDEADEAPLFVTDKIIRAIAFLEGYEAAKNENWNRYTKTIWDS